MSTPTHCTFNTTTIRVVKLDGNPWFVAKNVCQELFGDLPYGASQYTQALAKDEKKRVWSADPDYRDLFAVLHKVPSLSLISESGLYKLVMRSDKPEAKEFQDWVTRVVLPAIRKDGGYVMGEEKGKVSRTHLGMRPGRLRLHTRNRGKAYGSKA